MADRRPKPADAVRSAVDEAFQAAAGQAQSTRERASDLVDDLAGAAVRMRDVLDDLRPPSTDALRELRAEVHGLSERVGRLEARTRADDDARGTRAARSRAAKG